MTSTAQTAALTILAREWDTVGPPGIMDIPDVVTALSFPPGETLRALKELFANGLIDMNKFKTSVFLTPEGYDQATRQ